MRGPFEKDPIQSKILEFLKVYKNAFRYRLPINYKHLKKLSGEIRDP